MLLPVSCAACARTSDIQDMNHMVNSATTTTSTAQSVDTAPAPWPESVDRLLYTALSFRVGDCCQSRFRVNATTTAVMAPDATETMICLATPGRGSGAPV